jgi:hypothetical protein
LAQRCRYRWYRSWVKIPFEQRRGSRLGPSPAGMAMALTFLDLVKHNIWSKVFISQHLTNHIYTILFPLILIFILFRSKVMSPNDI